MASFSLLYWSHFLAVQILMMANRLRIRALVQFQVRFFCTTLLEFPDNEGMTIRLVGHGSTATSEVNGAYVFTSAPLGTYEMIFEKDGFGTFITEVEHTRSFEEEALLF